MWCHFNYFGIRARLLRDLVHHAHKVVQGLARFRFGWLDHHCFVNNEWKVDGWRVHAKVEDTLGYVEGRHTELFFLSFSGGNEFMLAHLWESDLVVF